MLIIYTFVRSLLKNIEFMNKFYTVFLASALACTSASAQLVKAPASARSSIKTETFQNLELQKKGQKEQRKNDRKATPRHTPAVKTVAAPSPDDKVIDETPAGTLTQCVKSGAAYGYSWLTGLIFQNIYGGLNNVVISDDNKHVYIQNPLFFNYASEDNWIVGDLEGDQVTFTFPQLIDVDVYYDDEGNVEEAYYDYALRLEFEVEDPDTQEGWYYPSENQTYKLRLNSDGSLTSLEDEGVMIGMCAYFEGDDLDEGEEPYWSWQGNGDFFYDIKPLTEKPLEVPSDVEFAEWQYLSEVTSRPVQVGTKGDTMYIKGLFSNMSDSAVAGKIEGDKVVFESGQYMGAYTYGGTTIYFLGGTASVEEDEYGEYKSFKIGDNLTFSYDREKNILQTDGAYCISCAPDKVLYYLLADKPYICIPVTDINVKQLLTPTLSGFYDADEEYDYDAEFYFIFPTIDADKQILPKDRLFYQVIMDDEIFTFYDDEYELPQGVSETTEIPYGYASEDTYDFDAYGTEHGFTFHTRGFESLGVRTLYKADNGDVVYSGMLWAPGYQGTFESGVNGIAADSVVKTVEYYDINGVRVNRPASGVYIMRATLSDGTVSVRKVLAR